MFKYVPTSLRLPEVVKTCLYVKLVKSFLKLMLGCYPESWFSKIVRTFPYLFRLVCIWKFTNLSKLVETCRNLSRRESLVNISNRYVCARSWIRCILVLFFTWIMIIFENFVNWQHPLYVIWNLTRFLNFIFRWRSCTRVHFWVFPRP